MRMKPKGAPQNAAAAGRYPTTRRLGSRQYFKQVVAQQQYNMWHQVAALAGSSAVGLGEERIVS